MISVADEIAKLDAAVFHQKDVLGLKIPVKDLSVVAMFDCQGDLSESI